ncbi:MAG: hypothetical protein Q8L78_02055 [Coxiellaceae bacterium]|nr:hypothetical protein [Coxiellaceae bacterium]
MPTKENFEVRSSSSNPSSPFDWLVDRHLRAIEELVRQKFADSDFKFHELPKAFISPKLQRYFSNRNPFQKEKVFADLLEAINGELYSVFKFQGKPKIDANELFAILHKLDSLGCVLSVLDYVPLQKRLEKLEKALALSSASGSKQLSELTVLEEEVSACLDLLREEESHYKMLPSIKSTNDKEDFEARFEGLEKAVLSIENRCSFLIEPSEKMPSAPYFFSRPIKNPKTAVKENKQPKHKVQQETPVCCSVM